MYGMGMSDQNSLKFVLIWAARYRYLDDRSLEEWRGSHHPRVVLITIIAVCARGKMAGIFYID